MRAGVPALRELLNDDLGLTFPDVRLVPTEELPPPAMRLKINDLEGLPWIGFAADRCMVNADPADISARLKSTDVEQTINPATGTPASIAAFSERPALDAMGYVTWSQAEHALLCLSASLRGHAGCFVDRQWIERATSTLGQLFPEVVAATDGAASPAQVTTLVRSLLDEGISVADLPLILEVLLEYSEGHDPTIPADAFIRARLRRAVIRRWSASRSHESLLAYLLASDVAAALTGDDGNGGLPEQERDALLDALQEEADFLPSGFGVPVLVTSPPARRALRNIVATEFPRMGVLSHTELPATTALHILGQIPERSPS
jgi:flagellar biosynthesis component FlhA